VGHLVPGAEPGGGGYIAQRMFSAKDERHSLLATLWFNIAHYAVRPWPWVLVGLASNHPLPESGRSGDRLYTGVDRLPAVLSARPHGWRRSWRHTCRPSERSSTGAQLPGERISTSAFWKARETDRHYVQVSQYATVLLTIVSAVITFYMDSIAGAWKLPTGNGSGHRHGPDPALVLWRINAWSEVSAMAAAVCGVDLPASGAGLQ